MNKSELAAAVADRAGTTQKQAGDVVEAVFEAMASTLAGGGEFRHPGFGTFSVADRAARTGRNPQTGDAIQIAASKAVRFKPAKALKEAVNGK